MKFLKFAKERFCFHIARDRRELLFHLLKNYPLIPRGYHKASLKEGLDKLAATEELLHEALDEQRTAHRKAIEQMLKARGRFKRDKDGYNFSLKREELEWLLQVFNDIRVGCWLILGQPDEQKLHTLDLKDELVPVYFTMEACCHFQMVLLKAVGAATG